MLRVFSHPDPAIAALVAGALDAEGIAATVRGTSYGAAMGELPPVAAWAEVWIADAGRAADAAAITRRAMPDDGAGDAADAAPWTCPACGETVDGVFGACWACGAPAV
jgi:hypothetical protein